MRSVRRIATVATVAALCSVLFASSSALAEWDSDPLNTQVVLRHHYLCGENDLPEEGIQGDVSKADQQSGRAEQGYNCGLALVGHARLNAGGRPETGNANMAWAGHCAYIAGPGGGVAPQTFTPPGPTNGVAVVDVSDSAHPKHVATLRTPGAAATSETLNAVTTPSGRSILVVGQYGNDVVKTGPKPMDIYDISSRDCTKFKLMATYDWPANIHNLTLSPDGKYVFATIPLQVVDISGLWNDPTPTTDPATKVKYLGNVQDAMDGPPVAPGPTADLDDPLFNNLPDAAKGQTTHPQNVSHEAWPSPDFASNPDHQYVYVGGQTAEFELFTILDLHAWLQRNPDGSLQDPNAKPVVVSQESGRGHSVRTATIGGKPYVLHSEESVFGAAYGCVPEPANPFAGPAQPWLTDISDRSNPVTVSQFGLEINDPKNCPEQLDSKANQSVHYHDVDDPSDTTFVIASMWNAGIRVFDVRDPANPTEVAYFNPGMYRLENGSTALDQAWAHSRYVPEKGEIWFATSRGGFWVVRIEGQLRRYLDLDGKNKRHGLAALNVPLTDPGAPGRVPAGTIVLPASAAVETAAYYCTLG